LSSRSGQAFRRIRFSHIFALATDRQKSRSREGRLLSAVEIAGHLSEWSEDKPGEWFALCFAERQGRYTAILFPNINQSIARFKVARIARYEEIVTAKDYQVLFRPLCFVAAPRHMFSQVRCRIPDWASVGFLDTYDVDLGKPHDIDPERIKMVGPFKVYWDCRPFDVDITGLVD